ncbi:MAG: XRE family transcriptional regulator [Candidatus Acididesulfobacter diazotrophicus]|uniref:XRE family transcriptional regulator n=1 Tax=Candidatus Acididesulfobacter diazotrophicus TaxID=2597226 RepID=A0A519BP17_9DELT|nr:MAG: XRE family transcriptional regulator [Candidatus Acididesulfobacter diazotrophicus]
MGRILQEIRQSKHITIAQMSDKFKVAAVHLNLIEVDKRLPSGELLEQIIKLFDLDGNTRDKLYLLLAKTKLQDKIPDAVLKKIDLKKDRMPDKFINRIKKDVPKKKTDRIKDAIEGIDILTKEEVMKLAGDLKQPVAEYLMLAGYIPDELLQLLGYKDFEKFLKSIAGFKDPVRIDKVISGLVSAIKGFTD